MLIRKNNFKYPKLERKESTGERLYMTPEGDLVPSVTTILSATKDMTGLIEWRKAIGDKRADQIVEDSCKFGTALHKCLEDFVMGVQHKTTRTNFIHKMSAKMADNIIEHGLQNLEYVYGVECSLYYPGLYAGTADLIAGIGDEIYIIDYKNSEKIKEEKYVEDYYLQGCAYALAHNKLYGTNISEIRIFMTTRPNIDNMNKKLEFKPFIIKGKQFDHYSTEWIKRLETYHSL